MSEKTIENNEELEIDLHRLVAALWKRLWLVILVPILCAVIALVGTVYLITPQYQSSAMFYVNNTSISVGGADLSISSGDLIASQNLVNSYIVILKTRTTLNDVIDYAGVDRTYAELKEMITAEAVNDTEIFKIVVTSPDPEEAEQIANAITQILPKRISSIIEGSSAKVVDTAVIASAPSSPSHSKNAIVGFALGLVLICGAIVLYEIFDVTIRTEEDVQRNSSYPLLAAVPDMSAPSKGGYGYGKYSKSSRPASAVLGDGKILTGSSLSFAASEAYKLLRTKVQFSFTDDSACHVIGVSSALTGEGKSLTSANLAASLAQLNERVLLIDCDMRRPSLNKKLGLKKAKGLSNYLTGQVRLEEVIQAMSTGMNGTSYHVLAAGRIPPNPIELLDSAKMNKLIKRMRDCYDYVILDLPPVSEVSDALVASKLTDGMLVVVRENYCNRPALKSTIKQLEFVGSRILGIVLNCDADNGSSYGKKYKYGSKRYYSAYEESYDIAQRSAKKASAKKTTVKQTPVEASSEKAPTEKQVAGEPEMETLEAEVAENSASDKDKLQ